jgi:uncharacterized membrane protein YagU involved in acid resistance
MHILYCIVQCILYCIFARYLTGGIEQNIGSESQISRALLSLYIYIYVSVLSRTSSNAIKYLIKTLDIFGHLIFYTGIANKFLYLSLFIREKGDNKTYFRW